MTTIIMSMILSLYRGSAAQKRKEKRERKNKKKERKRKKRKKRKEKRKRKKKKRKKKKRRKKEEEERICLGLLQTQMSWPQWLPGIGHSSLWWCSARMSTAGTGFCRVVARTAGCVFVDVCRRISWRCVRCACTDWLIDNASHTLATG